MQVFVPYLNPFYTAQALDKRRLNKQIIEARQIFRAMRGPSEPWHNHPIVKMWFRYQFWLSFYLLCLEKYRDGQIEEARALGHNCEMKCNRPEWLTKSLCVQHRRRLFTKDPKNYGQWARYGTSEENWYYTQEGKFLCYINGKRV